MDGFRARWTARWRRLHAGAWMPGAAAAAQWALVGCAGLATTTKTIGYLARPTALGAVLKTSGWLRTGALESPH